MKKMIFVLAIFVTAMWLPVTCFGSGIDKGEIPVSSISDKALQLFLDGREAFEMGRINDAKALFDMAVQQDSKFAMAYLYSAYTAKSESGWKSNFELALQNKSNISEGEKILIDLESVLSYQKNGERFELAKKLVELYPASLRARLILAGEYQLRNEFVKFRDQVSEGIRLNPDSPLGYRALAASYLLNDPVDFMLAEKYMTRFAELCPAEASAQLALGDVYRAGMKFLYALDCFSEAIRLNPGNDVAFSKRGYVNTYLGFFDDARADWEMANDLKKENSGSSFPNSNLTSWLFAGNSKLEMRFQNALVQNNNQVNKAKHPLESPEVDHYFCCTVVAMLHGVYVAPFMSLNENQCLEREFAMESKAPPAEIIEANIVFIDGIRAAQNGRFEYATQKAEEHALLVQPDKNPRKLEIYHYMMGYNALKQGKNEKAISHYLKSDIKNACVKYDLGMAYTNLHKWDKAKEVMCEVSQCAFTKAYKLPIAKIAQNWSNLLANIPVEE